MQVLSEMIVINISLEADTFEQNFQPAGFVRWRFVQMFIIIFLVVIIPI